VVEEPKVAATTSDNKADVISNAFNEFPDIIIEKLDLETIKNNYKHEMAVKISELIMNLLSLIVIYLVVKITLIIATFLLNGMMKLPILKQINEILGLLFGAIIGFVELYVAFAVFTLVSSITDISFIIDAIQASLIARIMFENNLIIKLLF